MKIRTVIGLAGASAASLVGMAGLVASPAGAAPATTMPAGNLTGYLATNYGDPFPGVPIFGAANSSFSSGGFPNVKVSGNCPSWVFTDLFAVNFVSGNAVVYRGSSSDVIPFLPGGLNAIGAAQLIDVNSGAIYTGSSHVWLGQGANPNTNGQLYAGETATFTGTSTDGSTISFSVNPGEVTSAGGHNGGWGQQNLSCSGFPTS